EPYCNLRIKEAITATSPGSSSKSVVIDRGLWSLSSLDDSTSLHVWQRRRRQRGCRRPCSTPSFMTPQRLPAVDDVRRWSTVVGCHPAAWEALPGVSAAGHVGLPNTPRAVPIVPAFDAFLIPGRWWSLVPVGGRRAGRGTSRRSLAVDLNRRGVPTSTALRRRDGAVEPFAKRSPVNNPLLEFEARGVRIFIETYVLRPARN